MDRDLEALRRAADATPQDPHTAQHLDRHLDRAGQHETLRERYRLKFQCDLRYDDLQPTPNPFQRHCARCRHDVHFVTTAAGLADAVARGLCVAMAGPDLPRALDALALHPDLDSADTPHPCVLPSAAAYVDLTTVTPTPAALDALPAGLAHSRSVLPISLDDDILTVAFGRTRDPQTLERLARYTRLTIREALANPKLVLQALDTHYGPYEPLEIMGSFVSAPPY